MKTVAEKMGIIENSRSVFLNAPPATIGSIALPELDVYEELDGAFDYIHAFVKTQEEQKHIFPILKKHLKLNGMLWISWPKNKQLATDLTLPKVIEIGYSFGLVESTCLSIDTTWSGLKFTHPKKGKEYNNSHAKLKNRTTNR